MGYVNSLTASQRGSLSLAQECALIKLVIWLGRPKFAEYRRIAGVGTRPIPRLSKSAAHRLIGTILQDLEARR